MKNKIIIYTILTLLCLIALPKKVEAQRRGRVKVKRSRVVVQKRGHVRPLRARRVAHYRYKGLPRWGRTVRAVGSGFATIRFGGLGFRFHKGVWYRPKGKRFIVARAPYRARLRVLPVGYRTIPIGSTNYFYYYGTFYTKAQDSKEEYEVIQPPFGAAIGALPEGYDVVKVNNMEFYKFEDTYYEPRINDQEDEYYVVVEDPTLDQ